MNAAQSDANAARLRAVGKGGRVQSTTHALAFGVFKTTKHGVIAGWGRHKWTVRVRLDGRKTVVTYHVDFWEPEAA